MSISGGAGGAVVRWLSTEERAAWLATVALMTRLPAALDADLEEWAGLSFFEYLVLAILAEQPDRTLRMSVIARSISSSPSRLSHTATRLEKRGLMTRTQLPGSGRRVDATLTDAGRDLVVAVAPRHVQTVRRLLIDAISPADLATLHEIGAKVLQQIDPTDDLLRPSAWGDAE